MGNGSLLGAAASVYLAAVSLLGGCSQSAEMFYHAPVAPATNVFSSRPLFSSYACSRWRDSNNDGLADHGEYIEEGKFGVGDPIVFIGNSSGGRLGNVRFELVRQGDLGSNELVHKVSLAGKMKTVSIPLEDGLDMEGSYVALWYVNNSRSPTGTNTVEVER
ncbi:MAG: hypothetical protein DRP02_13110 [Candidatus Gerdarchaeota archaeon]|nr:MAG: hypothetical protein DRP02_13110 [Candidatus Gerdarchaeota archaeon]